MDNTAYAPGVKVHVFELRNLGPAPYVLTGVTEKRHPNGDGTSRPGSCCDYCLTGIALEFWLRAADGRRFKVGSDCILKTSSDRALVVAVKTEVQARQKAQRDARAEIKRQSDIARINAAKARLVDVADSLRAEPHPRATEGDFFATKTRLDWAEWMLANAGISGRLTVANVIESRLQAVSA